MHSPSQCGYNDVSNVTVGALLRPKGGHLPRLVRLMANQTDGMFFRVVGTHGSVLIICDTPYKFYGGEESKKWNLGELGCTVVTATSRTNTHDQEQVRQKSP